MTGAEVFEEALRIYKHMDSGKNAQEHFIKQRRNLFAVSLFAIFFSNANLDIKQINILGNYADIKNPDIIPYAVLTVLIYLLWRYFTACREIEGVSKFRYACTGWAEEKLKNKREKEISETKDNDDLDFRVNLINRAFSSRTYQTDYSSFIFDEDIDGHNEEVTFKWLFCGYALLSLIPTIFTTSTFSEYVLPYIIAFIALHFAIPLIFQ